MRFNNQIHETLCSMLENNDSTIVTCAYRGKKFKLRQRGAARCSVTFRICGMLHGTVGSPDDVIAYVNKHCRVA